MLCDDVVNTFCTTRAHTDNLLVFSVSHNATVNVKLSDFGTAITVNDLRAAKKHTGNVGTPVYMAPEVMGSLVCARVSCVWCAHGDVCYNCVRVRSHTMPKLTCIHSACCW
jgi:serine/threonine protein kinase